MKILTYARALSDRLLDKRERLLNGVLSRELKCSCGGVVVLRKDEIAICICEERQRGKEEMMKRYKYHFHRSGKFVLAEE